MYSTFLVTTSTEGLQPLGPAALRSYELVTGTLAQRFGPEYAALFAEPIAAPHGDRIDWHARAQGSPDPFSALSADEQVKLRTKLGQYVERIQAEAESLSGSFNPDDQRLSEALLNATEIPSDQMIYAVRDATGDVQPVLVHWAWIKSEQEAVRGVLSAMVPRRAPIGGPAEVTSSMGAGVWSSPVWWWLILLGWLLLALLVSAILYILIAPCGLRPLGPQFCPADRAALQAEFAEQQVIEDAILRLEHELAFADRMCQPTISPAALPVPSTPAPERKGSLQRGQADILKRVADRGGAHGPLNFALEWNSIDNVDLHVTCPGGETLSPDHRAGCGGAHDLEANSDAALAVSDPVENVFFSEPVPGLYKVRAALRDERTKGEKPVVLHVLRRQAEPQQYAGQLGRGSDDWTVNISISR